jgi:hypothetical protein
MKELVEPSHFYFLLRGNILMRKRKQNLVTYTLAGFLGLSSLPVLAEECGGHWITDENGEQICVDATSSTTPVEPQPFPPPVEKDQAAAWATTAEECEL